jgi:hypothetical protein
MQIFNWLVSAITFNSGFYSDMYIHTISSCGKGCGAQIPLGGKAERERLELV